MARKSASGEEAAAVAAAIARFEAEFAAAPAAAPDGASAWQRAALLEGVGAKENPLHSGGETKWQS